MMREAANANEGQNDGHREGGPFLKLGLWMATLVVLAACSSGARLGEIDAGEPDTGGRTGPYDECGNGMDDDVDGVIDEQCPCGAAERQSCYNGTYPTRSIGRCADGVQACDAQGGEFGFWGACTGDTLPSEEELCDGALDDDCDGAVDEGCPCTVGQTFDCATEFVIAPCTGGRQTCSAEGVWGACEGAIGPQAEVCDDGVDNDCDGTPDEGCDCVPEPEICGDGIDNDCDGEEDEVDCYIPPLDAGVVDASMDGGVDAGPACTTLADLRWDRLSRPSSEPLLDSSSASRSVWTGSEHVFLYAAGSGETGAADFVQVSRYDALGTYLTTHSTAISLSGFQRTRGLVWTGSTLVLLYDQGGRLELQRMNLDGTLVGDPVRVEGVHGALGWNGSQVGVAYRGAGADAGLYLQTFTPALATDGAPVEVVAPGVGRNYLLEGGQRLAWTGARWLMTWLRTDPYEVGLSVIGSGGVERTEIAARPGGPSGMGAYDAPTLAGGDGSGLWCWRHVFATWEFDVWCQRLSADGASMGAPVQLSPRVNTMGAAVGLIRWPGAGYVMIFASTTAGQSHSAVWVDGEDSLRALPLPEDMDGSVWGFAYWEGDFGLLEASPHQLLMQGRGDPLLGDPMRRGYPHARVRLRCP